MKKTMLSTKQSYLVCFIGILAAFGIAVSSAGKRGRAKTGLVLNCVVIVVATWRLGLGGGLI